MGLRNKLITADDFGLTISNSILTGNTTGKKEKKSKEDEVVMELSKHFDFGPTHEERLRALLKNDESLLETPSHLVVAASLSLSDGTKMEGDGIRAYEMGDKIVIEEQDEDGTWQVQRTIGVQIAQLLAHARAKKRMKEIENLMEGIGKDPMDRLDELDIPDGGGPFDHPKPPKEKPKTYPRTYPTNKPYWVGDSRYWVDDGTHTTQTSGQDTPKSTDCSQASITWSKDG